MDRMTREELGDLVRDFGTPRVSIFMPTVKAGAEIQQNAIRFKNLLRQAEEALEEHGLRSAEARQLLEPAWDLVEDGSFWEHQEEGLAVFLEGGSIQTYRMPIEFEELVVAGDRFLVKPLLPYFAHNGHFFLLALSEKQVRLLEASRHSVSEVPLQDLPKSLAEALRWDDPEKQLQWHASRGASTGGDRPDPNYHGHPAGTDERREKTDLLRFFQEIDEGLQDFLAEARAPLVLAGVEYYLPIFQEASSYQHLVEEVIAGNPEELRDDQLHERALELVEPIFDQGVERAADLYRQLAGQETGRASKDVRAVAQAAYIGRVAQVFLPIDLEVWGAFDPVTGQAELHEQVTGDSQDLLNHIAVHTLLNNGEVYAVPPGEMPAAGTVAAIYRY